MLLHIVTYQGDNSQLVLVGCPVCGYTRSDNMCGSFEAKPHVRLRDEDVFSLLREGASRIFSIAIMFVLSSRISLEFATVSVGNVGLKVSTSQRYWLLISLFPPDPPLPLPGPPIVSISGGARCVSRPREYGP